MLKMGASCHKNIVWCKVQLSNPKAELRILEVFYHKIYKVIYDSCTFSWVTTSNRIETGHFSTDFCIEWENWEHKWPILELAGWRGNWIVAICCISFWNCVKLSWSLFSKIFRFQRRNCKWILTVKPYTYTTSHGMSHKIRWYLATSVIKIQLFVFSVLLMLHFQLQNFGEPFFMVVRENETLATLKERLKKKLQVRDEEFAKVII